MKRFAKIVALILVLCQMACFFSACKNEQDGTPDEPVFDLTTEALSQYKIVYANLDSEMSTVATTLQGYISKAMGIKLEIKTDKLQDGSDVYCETEYEIFVGRVNRSQAREVYSTVKKNDMGYALSGKKLFIIGFDQSSVSSAAAQFKINVLDKVGSDGMIMRSGDKNIIQGTYDYDELKLQGVDINKYKIVYSQWNDHGELNVAQNLRDWISEKTGYVLECADDTSEVSEYGIIIGDSTRVTDAMRTERTSAGYTSGKSYIGLGDKTVWLSGNNSVTLHQALSKLLKSAEYTEDTVMLGVDKSGCVSFDGEFSLSVMNYNVYYDLGESKRNANDVIVSVKQKSPDIFGLNEAGKKWINKFLADTDISQVYGCVEGKAADNTSDASYNPIFYKKDKYEVIESGTKWLSKTPDKMSMDSDAKHCKILTYAIFKDKVIGTEFMYINVHLDGSNDSDAHATLKEVRKRQAETVKAFAAEYALLPIIIGGDFNEGPSSAVIGGMSKNTRFRYCMDVAAKTVNLNSTDVNSSFDSISSGVIFDYLFVSADYITVQKYEQCDNKINGKYPSDHLPVYAEITIKY